MQYVLITGVSTGIGLATTRLLIEKGLSVIGTVREVDHANNLSKLWGSNFFPVVTDVTDPDGIESAFDEVQRIIKQHPLIGLVNNAGIVVTGPLTHVGIKKVNHQFDVNVLGPLRMIQQFYPLLKRSKPSKIINISSLSGGIALPFTGPYSASKFALEALSDSLRRELYRSGISVVVIQPGPVKTPIWEKGLNGERYQDTEYAEAIRNREKFSVRSIDRALEPENVAQVIFKAINKRNPRTRYVVTRNKLKMWYLPRLMPDKWLDFFVAQV